MFKRARFLAVSILILSTLFLALGCGASKKEGSQAPAASASPTGNVQSSIQSVSIVGPPVVTFTLFDQTGAPLDPNAVIAGGGRVRFFIAQIGADGNYKNYLGSSGLPTYNSGGTIAALGNGVYTYTFTKDITNIANTLNGLVYDPTLTHTAAAQIQRTTTSPTGGSFEQAVNPYLTFRPDGGAVTVTREIVSVSSCNECHGKLALHGGGRRDVALCILCHYPGPADTVTGNLIDFKSMIHKIHMGKMLRSNVAGGDYTIGTSSFKTVGYPAKTGDSFSNAMPINCVKCHKLGTDAQGNAYGKDVNKWKQAPTVEKCTTCHDVTTFDGSTTIQVLNGSTPITVTATPHFGGTQSDDSGCAGCHPATGLNDYSDVTISGAPVPSAHLLPMNSSLYTGMNFSITSVTGLLSGQTPSVTFTVKDDSGNNITLTGGGGSGTLADSVTMVLAYMTGPDYDNTDSAWLAGQTYVQAKTKAVSGTASSANPNNFGTNGTYVADFGAVTIPSGTGVASITIYGRKGITIPISVPNTHRIAAQHITNVFAQPVFYFFDPATGNQVTDPASQRREVVSIDKCNNCHLNWNVHSRNDTKICVQCHAPNLLYNTTEGYSGNLKDMVHGIHGAQVSTVVFKAVGVAEYPNDPRNCTACHISAATAGLPLPTGVVAGSRKSGTTTISLDGTPVLPIKAACTACHEDATATKHADDMVVSGVEICIQCHTTGLRYGTDYAHYPVR